MSGFPLLEAKSPKDKIQVSGFIPISHGGLPSKNVNQANEKQMLKSPRLRLTCFPVGKPARPPSIYFHEDACLVKTRRA